MAFSPVIRVAVLCAAARIAYLLVLLALDRSFADYDTSTELLHSFDKADAPSKTAAAWSPWDGTAVWDAVFMTRIAERGYEYEQFYAFFPLLPGAMRAGAQLTRLPPAAVGLAISLTACVAAAVALYRLSERVLGDGGLAALSALLFVFSPASPFYAAAYTEALFAVCSFGGMLCLSLNDDGVGGGGGEGGATALGKRGRGGGGGGAAGKAARWLLAVCLFAAAAAARSNGVLHCGFLLHRALRSSSRSSSCASGTPLLQRAVSVVGALLGCAAIAAPSLAFQWAGSRAFCSDTGSGSSGGGGSDAGGSVSAPPRPWCHGTAATQVGAFLRPRLYRFVQAQYWGVGPFRYWRLQQLPNFALAAPVLMFTAAGCWAYWSADWRRAVTGGLLPPPPLPPHGKSGGGGGTGPREPHSNEAAGEGGAAAAGRQLRQRRGASLQAPAASAVAGDAPQGAASDVGGGDMRVAAAAGGRRIHCGYLGNGVAVYVYQWAAMALVALVAMHVQVSTRFLSSCPPLYWFAAHQCRRSSSSSSSGGGGDGRDDSSSSGDGGGRGPRRWWRHAVWGYCLAYASVGAVMFGNFYPWT